MTDTLQAVENAIQKHIASHFEGALVDSWVIVCHAQNIEEHDLSNYRLLTPETQPFHVDAGLMDVGERIIAGAWDDWNPDDDD